MCQECCEIRASVISEVRISIMWGALWTWIRKNNYQAPGDRGSCWWPPCINGECFLGSWIYPLSWLSWCLFWSIHSSVRKRIQIPVDPFLTVRTMQRPRSSSIFPSRHKLSESVPVYHPWSITPSIMIPVSSYLLPNHILIQFPQPQNPTIALPKLLQAPLIFPTSRIVYHLRPV